MAGPAQVVRTVTVPCLRQGPYRDTPAGPAAARTAPGQWSTDQAQGTTASRNAGQTRPGTAPAYPHRRNGRSSGASSATSPVRRSQPSARRLFAPTPLDHLQEHHGRSHRFEPCHAYLVERLPGVALSSRDRWLMAQAAPCPSCTGSYAEQTLISHRCRRGAVCCRARVRAAPAGDRPLPGNPVTHAAPGKYGTIRRCACPPTVRA